MIPFKKNLHKAKEVKLKKIENLIKNYNPRFSPPKYLHFIKDLLKDGWRVKLYTAGVSKYVFVYKVIAGEDIVYKIRFSNHKPIYEKEIENDCDFYVGISNTQACRTEDILKIIRERHPLEVTHG